jgi:hypothetical protein
MREGPAGCGAQATPTTLKFRTAITIKKTALTRIQRLAALDPGDLLRADPEARWASWQRARQAGVLSPNDVRREEGWPASNDPTADSIEPPAMGGAKPGDGGDAPAPAPSDEGRVARLDERRAR